MMKRDDCLAALLDHHQGEVIAAVYGAAFDLLRMQPDPLLFVSFGAMGLLSSQALGIALGRPDKRIIVLDGDGSLLMNLGTLVTIGEIAPPNFIHFVCENGTYEANGGHPIPGQGRVRFADLARAAGYRNAYEFSELEDFKARIGSILRETGPVFIALKIEPGEPSPQPWSFIHGAASRNQFRAALNAAEPPLSE
jgi:sulfopyruvate decarboxylase subunit beta